MYLLGQLRCENCVAFLSVFYHRQRKHTSLLLRLPVFILYFVFIADFPTLVILVFKYRETIIIMQKSVSISVML